MTAPGGPRGAEDMPYWEISTNAGDLVGRRGGIGHVAGFIQPVFNVAATPAARAVPARTNYFYGSTQLSARTNRYEGMFLEADGGGESFFKDAFSMIGNLVVETVGLGPLIRPLGAFIPSSDVAVVIEAVTLSFPGASGNYWLFVSDGNELNLDVDTISPGSLQTAAAASSTLAIGSAIEPGGISQIEQAVAAPHVGRKNSAIEIRYPGSSHRPLGAPLFPAALQPGEVFHIVGKGGVRCSIVWSEFA